MPRTSVQRTRFLAPLRACYAMSGIDIAHRANPLCALCAMSGRDTAYYANLRMPSTDVPLNRGTRHLATCEEHAGTGTLAYPSPTRAIRDVRY
eukprot:3747133-Rhodomonas_salina.4